MFKLLVIGGTGFFGKSILDSFNRGLLEPWGIGKVIVMARNPEKTQVEFPELLNSNIEFIKGDITRIHELPRADYVIHAAATTDSKKYLSESKQERNNIIMGVLNYCRLAPVYHKNSKIVFCSSGAVYGAQPSNVPALSENMALGQIEDLSEEKKAYAYAKHDSEAAIIQLGNEYQLNVSIARCFTFIGKYLPKDQHFAIGNFISDIEANRPVGVKSNKAVFRSYMHADDLVIWLMTLAENSKPESPIYNVGSDEIVELHFLARELGRKYGNGSRLMAITSNKVDRYIPDLSKAKSTLSLSNSMSLMEALELLVCK